LATHFEEAPYFLAKWEAEKPYAIVYYDGEKDKHMVKRCVLEPKNDQWDYLISDHAQSEVQVISAADQVDIEVTFKKVKGKDKDPETLNLQDFIAVKGWKAAGNQLTTWPVKGITVLREENEAPPADTVVASVSEEAVDWSEPNGTDEAASTLPSSPVTDTQLAALAAEEKSAPEKPSITLEVVDLTASEPPAASEASEEDDSDQEEDGQFTLKF